MDNLIVIIISFVVSVGIGIVIQVFTMKMIDAEYCRNKFVSLANSEIETKIKRLEDLATSLALKIGAGLGLCVSILFFSIGIFKFKGIISTILKFLSPFIPCILIAFIVAALIVNVYCVKHFGKTLAFLDMINNASIVKYSVCKETVSPVDEKSTKYGDQYLVKLGTGLNSSISRTVWFYRVIGAVIGFAAGIIPVFLLSDNIIITILAGVVGEAIFVILFNVLARKHCINHYGYLSTYYQLHIDIYSIKKQLENGGLNSGKVIPENMNAYSAKTENQREEKINSISLKDGYQFASVPSRIFAEKTDNPGSYCCPYCYTEVSSEVSSMCVNCGKSLGVDVTKDYSPKAEPVSSEVPKETQVNEANTKVSDVKENEEGKVPPKKKKLFIGIGIGAVALAGVVAAVIYVANKGLPFETKKTESVLSDDDWNELMDSSYLDALNDIDWSAFLDDDETVENEENDVITDIPQESHGIVVGSVLRCDSNLRLRASESADSSVITTMSKDTTVKVIKIGKEDVSEGITSNWVQVEVLPGGKDRDSKRIPDGTVGWCFGGFLKP